MKYVLPIVLLGMVVIMPACQNSSAKEDISELSDTENSLVGEWERTYVIYPQADGTVRRQDAETGNREIKIFTETHMAGMFVTKEGEFINTTFGTYTFGGQKIVETLKFSSNPDWIGVYESSIEWTDSDSFIKRRPSSHGGMVEDAWKRSKW